MKNFFFLLFAFPTFSILTACGALMGLEDNDKSCDLGNGDQTQVWDQVEYLLPECWKVTSTYPDLVLEGLGAHVKISTLPFEGEETSTMKTLNLDYLETLYVLPTYTSESPMMEEDVQNILDSLTRYPFSIASSSCEAPDGTYAESINYGWLGLTFALPYCWGAEEKLVYDEPFEKDILTLTKGDDSRWVKISLGSGSTTETITPTRTDHENYSSFDYNGYFYAETNAPDEHDVQIILNSLILEKSLAEACVESTQTGLDFEYLLPACWTASMPSADQLILQNEKGDSQVFMHYHEPDPETLGHVARKANPEAVTLYIEYTDSEDHEIQGILDSITWPVP